MVPLSIALAVCLPVCAVAAPAGSQRGAAWSVRITPQRVVNGAPVLLAVTAPATLNSLSGTWMGHELVFDHSTGNNWFALAGVSLETQPGKYPLKLEGVTASGEKVLFERTLLVTAAKYPTVKLTVSKEFTAPSPEQQEKIKADQELKHEVFSRVSPEREWSG
jgi:hypothetical protein